ISATLNPVSPMPAEGPGSPPADGDPVSDPPEPPAADPEPGQADAGPSQRGAAPSGAEPDVPGRPALGWPGSGSAETPDEPVPPSDAGAPAVTDAPPPSSPSTVEVRPGDSLWSITDELLGPGLDDPDAISSLWPVLHDVNGDVIGTDPDHIEPGQVLIVPAQITSQENAGRPPIGVPQHVVPRPLACSSTMRPPSSGWSRRSLGTPWRSCLTSGPRMRSRVSSPRRSKKSSPGVLP